jgi:hypothetical protein
MSRAATFVMFIGTALITAGAYGALHHQISYTVSPEYCTQVKS